MLCRDSCRETWPEKFGKNYKVSLNALNTDDVNDRVLLLLYNTFAETKKSSVLGLERKKAFFNTEKSR